MRVLVYARWACVVAEVRQHRPSSRAVRSRAVAANCAYEATRYLGAVR